MAHENWKLFRNMQEDEGEYVSDFLKQVEQAYWKMG